MKKKILVALLMIWAVGATLSHTAAGHHGLADASSRGSLGGILIGLALLVPAVGLFAIIRMFSRWQRGFHHRMKTQGITPRRSSQFG